MPLFFILNLALFPKLCFVVLAYIHIYMEPVCMYAFFLPDLFMHNFMVYNLSMYFLFFPPPPENFCISYYHSQHDRFLSIKLRRVKNGHKEKQS